MHGINTVQKRRRTGFTLIEMLVVVAIMMLLAGLILTGLNLARNRAKSLRARRDVAQLITAWTAYFAEYHRFPPITEGTVGGNSVANGRVLTGRDTIQILRGLENHNGQNPRKIPYMDFHPDTTRFPDPWNNLYRIIWDVDNDGQINVPGEALALRVSLAVWSAGPDGLDETKDDIRSWRPQ